MDGIDISLVKTNGLDLIRYNENYFYEYSDKTKDYLLSILDVDINLNIERKHDLDKLITYEHYKALKSLKILEKSELIAFHGQTIYHNPKVNISLQLGNPKQLAKMLKKNVIFDFRSNDIALGGQGAPLAPIYHQFLINSLDIELPSCILNIGGVSNLTFWDGNKLIGFDTGPGNGLMDSYIKLKTKKYFDKNGEIASQGIPNRQFINKFINNIFFLKRPPKSLDRNSFKVLYDELLAKDYSIQDTTATLAECTVETIIMALSSLPKKVKNIMITGGGYKNKYLMRQLKKRLNTNFILENDININFDYIESELIAFLGARSIYNLPYTFPSTTGISKPASGGKIFNYL